MEGDDQNQNLGNNGPGGSRWNPTKEQINMLESLYRQGLRTPTAEQIQQITTRLRVYGHIEGKNVFYWFQNHKARQRQKQKQENFAYFNRFLHSSPVFPPYHHNVACSPCYMPPPKNEQALYQQYPKVPLPAAGGFMRSIPIPDSTCQRYNKPMHDPRIINSDHACNLQSKKHSSHHHQETLDLFPIHPTGILKSRNESEDNDSCISANDTPSCSVDIDCSIYGDHGENGKDDQPFFDFFCGN